MTIFSATLEWIPQASKTVRKFASGLEITEQEFIFPGPTTNPPKNKGDNLNGGNVFPQPSVSTNEDGISSSLVTSYRVFGADNSNFEKIESKILKTGETVTITNGTDAETGLSTSTTSYGEFQYLARRVQQRIACQTDNLVSPLAPTFDSENDLIVTSGWSSSFDSDKTWLLSQYEVQNYGDISEVTFTYEIVGKLTRTVNP